MNRFVTLLFRLLLIVAFICADSVQTKIASDTWIEQLRPSGPFVSAPERGGKRYVTTYKKSIIRQAIDRFDSFMAINESRSQAKEAVREAGEYHWAFTTGRIHSFKTRSIHRLSDNKPSPDQA